MLATRSKEICAASASSSTPQVASWAAPSASAAITIAGPTAYQPSAIVTSSRSGWARLRRMSGSSPISEPIATSAGTAAAGVRNSIGTNTICVGRISPGPSGKRTRRTSA